jgi:ankyrin repeat protein
MQNFAADEIAIGLSAFPGPYAGFWRGLIIEYNEYTANRYLVPYMQIYNINPRLFISQDDRDQTPLHRAATRDHKAVAELLRQHGGHP